MLASVHPPEATHLISSHLLLQVSATVAEGSGWSPGPRSAAVLVNRRCPAEAPPLPRVSGGATEPGGVLPGYGCGA